MFAIPKFYRTVNQCSMTDSDKQKKSILAPSAKTHQSALMYIPGHHVSYVT